MEGVIHLAIAENEGYQTDLLVHRLSRYTQVKIIFTANNGLDLLNKVIEQGKPHVVLMDIQMPVMGGIEATNTLSKKHPDVKVIAFSQWDNIERVASMILHGAVAFVSKTLPTPELVEIISAVHLGQHRLADHPYALPVMEKIKEMKETGQHLTPKMQKVLMHVCNELSSKEIAELMEVSVDSIKGYRKDLFKITGVKNMAGLVRYAVQHGYLTPEENGHAGLA